jgi:hypothetical protein
MNDNDKAKLVLVMVPLILFSGLFGYLHYKEYQEQKNALQHWNIYASIKANSVTKPDANQTRNSLSWSSSRLTLIHEKHEYPVIIETYYVGMYERYTFWMPWNDVEVYWNTAKMESWEYWSIS